MADVAASSQPLHHTWPSNHDIGACDDGGAGGAGGADGGVVAAWREERRSMPRRVPLRRRLQTNNGK
jgi:hypothetical protein